MKTIITKKLKIYGEPIFGGATFINGVRSSVIDCNRFLEDLLKGNIVIKSIFIDQENDCEIETF